MAGDLVHGHSYSISEPCAGGRCRMVCVQLFSLAVEMAPEPCPSLFIQGLQRQGVRNPALGTRSLCVQHLSLCLKRKPSQTFRGELENSQQLCEGYQPPTQGVEPSWWDWIWFGVTLVSFTWAHFYYWAVPLAGLCGSPLLSLDHLCTGLYH